MEELNRLEVDEFLQAKKIPVVLVMDNVRSMLNVGSAFRTGDAFLVEKIYLTGFTGTPPHREIQKTALGATESVAWEQVADESDLAKRLLDAHYKIVPIEQAEGSTSLQDFVPQPEKRYAFIFGNEVTGVSEVFMEAAQSSLEIPQYGTKHSLNISVSIGIVLWEFYRKMLL